MQSRNYSIPSARSRGQLRRSTLTVAEKTEQTDDSWLNDIRSTSSPMPETQEHAVFYEDLPTMPLAFHEPLEETDKTIKLNRGRPKQEADPLEALLADETITAVTVLGPRRIYVERDGQVQETPCRFTDEQHMLRVIDKLLHAAGLSMSVCSPLTDVQLPDGSSLTIAMPPSAANGPALTIRKRAKKLVTLSDLVRLGSISQAMANVLIACVQARLNIVVCGRVGSGRTTFLNALCTTIAQHERIVTIEDVAELYLRQPQVVSLVTHHAGCDGTEQITMRDLVIHAQRLRAQRIVIDECRSNEAVELLQTMYNGLDGIMMALYAHSVRDCLARFETLCLAGSSQVTLSTPSLIRTQIAQSLNIIVSLSSDHKVTNIAEVQYADRSPLKVQSLFHYRATSGKSGEVNAHGTFEPSGFYPTFLEKYETMRTQLPREMFFR